MDDADYVWVYTETGGPLDGQRIVEAMARRDGQLMHERDVVRELDEQDAIDRLAVRLHHNVRSTTGKE